MYMLYENLAVVMVDNYKIKEWIDYEVNYIRDYNMFQIFLLNCSAKINNTIIST